LLRAVNAEQPDPDDMAGCFYGDGIAIGDANHAGRERVRSQRGQQKREEQDEAHVGTIGISGAVL